MGEKTTYLEWERNTRMPVPAPPPKPSTLSSRWSTANAYRKA